MFKHDTDRNGVVSKQVSTAADQPSWLIGSLDSAQHSCVAVGMVG